MDTFPEAAVGKILIQRDESSSDKHARVRRSRFCLSVVLLQQAPEGYRQEVRVHLRSHAGDGRQRCGGDPRISGAGRVSA